MITFKLYCIGTIITTIYYTYKLYERENLFFIFSMHILKSKFYFSLFLNFGIMITIFLGKLCLKIFYGEIRLSEISQVIEKIKIKFIQISLLFLMLSPTFDLSKLFLVSLFFFMSLLTYVGFKRSAYIVSMNEKSKYIQMKIIIIFLILGTANFFLYEKYYVTLDQMRTTKNNDIKDLFISFIFSSEFLILFIKLIAKFYKLLINITSINVGKVWEYRPLVFSLISTVKYSVKLLCEINFCYVLFKLGGTNIYYLIDIIKGIWHLLKLIQKIYDNYISSIYINNLKDYQSDITFEKIEKSRPGFSEEEKEKLKNELSVICNICLYEIDKGKYLQCGHIFHIKCIKEWIIVNSNCPICKSPIINKNGIHSKYYNQQLGINDTEKQTNEILKKLNIGKETFIPKKNYEIEKYNYYRKLDKLLEKTCLNYKNNQDVNPGSISYSLPSEAILDRNIKNEIKRIEIEVLNKKLMSIYQNPVEVITNFKEKIE